MTQLELYQSSLPVSESILGKLEGTRCATARTAGSTAVYCSYCWQYSSILSYCWQYSSILPVLLLLLLLLTSCRWFRIIFPVYARFPLELISGHKTFICQTIFKTGLENICMKVIHSANGARQTCFKKMSQVEQMWESNFLDVCVFSPNK